MVGTQVMDYSSLHYFEQTQSALTNMWEVYSGLIKSLAFGLIIGLVGCYKGMHTGNTSLSLGKSVTSAVVVSITQSLCVTQFLRFYQFFGLPMNLKNNDNFILEVRALELRYNHNNVLGDISFAVNPEVAW